MTIANFPFLMVNSMLLSILLCKHNFLYLRNFSPEYMITNCIASYSEGIPEDDFQVIVDVLPSVPLSEDNNDAKELREILDSTEKKQKAIEERLAVLNADIDRLTSKADWVDYTVAASAGIICGLIDTFFVGAFDIDSALENAKNGDAVEKVNAFVQGKAENIRLKETIDKNVKNAISKAKKKGKNLSSNEIDALKQKIAEGLNNKLRKVQVQDAADGTTKALARAINKLEEHFPLPMDDAYNGVKGISAATHHLDDIAHHPTPLGMVAAILGSILKIAFLEGKDGKMHIRFPKDLSKEEFKEWMLKVIVPISISGILTWMIYHAKNNGKISDEKIPKPIQAIVVALAQTPAAISVLSIINNWLGHLASDVAGSSSSANKSKRGMGVSGFFLSSLKELSMIYPLNKTAFPKMVDDLYEKDHLDFRTELGMQKDIWKYLGKQTIPVIAGQVLVRAFYFIRHLIDELKGEKQLADVNWRSVLPFGNRTIVRMVTVESAVFTMFDVCSAAISASKNGGPQNPFFWKDLIFNINFVGVGNLAISIGTDVKMGVNRYNKVNERIACKNAALQLQESRVYVRQGEMWMAAENTAAALSSLMNTAEKTASFYNQTLNTMTEEWSDAVDVFTSLKQSDPVFFEAAFGDL